jgi:hypothetical protein
VKKRHVEERWHRRGIGSWRLGGAGNGGAGWDAPRSPPGGNWLARGCPSFRITAKVRGFQSTKPVELVERVRVSAERHAVLALDAVTMAVPHILGVALRKCPQLPHTIAERITDYRAQNNADWVMYRMALASAAEARGWPVHWYDARKVLGAASQALGVENLDAHFLKLRRTIGPPWNNDHKLAMAAAIAAATGVAE